MADLSAAPVTIPPDQNEATLVVQAGDNATEGALANLVVRAEMAYDGKAEVDIPIKVTVAK